MTAVTDWRQLVRNWAASQDVTVVEDASTVAFRLRGAGAVDATLMEGGSSLRLFCLDEEAVPQDAVDGVLEYCNTWNGTHLVPSLHVRQDGDTLVTTATAHLPLAAAISQHTFDEFLSYVVGAAIQAIDGLHGREPVGSR